MIDNLVFNGYYSKVLDERCRLTIPEPFRSEISEKVTEPYYFLLSPMKERERSMLVQFMYLSEYEATTQAMNQRDFSDTERIRFFAKKATQLDGWNRINLGTELASQVGFKPTLTLSLIGHGNSFGIYHLNNEELREMIGDLPGKSSIYDRMKRTFRGLIK